MSNSTAQQATLGAPGTADYCYPTVASFSTGISGTDAMIAFLRSAPNSYPEARVVNCDEALNWSPTTLVKSGETFVDFLQGNERWGDYTGICRKHNAGQPTVWVAACYGANIPSASTNNTYKTWVAEVQGSGTVGLPEAAPSASGMRVFPNPAIDLFQLDFTLSERGRLRIELVDARGAQAKLIFEEDRSPADYRISFNRGALASGTYTLLVRSNETIIGHETLVIQ